MNWVLQLNNSQKVKLFNSLLEKHRVLNSPNQPNPNPIQSVIDLGNLRVQKICVKLETLSEDIRVEQAHDGTGQPVEQNSSSAHTVKEQFAPEENRDIASFNADNEFNRAINEENIDFNIPGVPNSMVKRHFKVIFNNIDSSILSAKNHKT